MSYPLFEYPSEDYSQMTHADFIQLSEWESFNSAEHEEGVPADNIDSIEDVDIL